MRNHPIQVDYTWHIKRFHYAQSSDPIDYTWIESGIQIKSSVLSFCLPLRSSSVTKKQPFGCFCLVFRQLNLIS